MTNVMRHPGSFGVRRPDRSVNMRIPPGSFTQDPGMRAPDEFQDVGSAGYREQAKRVAERGGARQYATSVEEEERKKQAEKRRTQVAFALALLASHWIARGMIGPRGSVRYQQVAGLAPGTNSATAAAVLAPEARDRGLTPGQIGRRLAQPALGRINEFLEKAYADAGISLWGRN
jgi:hypothetical protein